MSRLLHIADVHLDAPFGGFGREAEMRRREVLDAFRGLPELAREREVAAVLIAGDLFDGPRPSEASVIAVRETARRFMEAEIALFAVPGNHDAIALAPTLYEDALAGATVFTLPRFGAPVTIHDADPPLHVYGVAYDAAEEPDPLATFRRSDEPGHHVVLLHGAVPGAPHWGAGSALRLPIERLTALGADYVALGDHHRHRPPSEFEAGLAACYAGSFAAVDLTEFGPRGAVVVELGAGAPPPVELVSVGAREVVHVAPFDVTPFGSETEVADAIGARLPGAVFPVVTLEGEPGFPLDAEGVRRRLEERFGCTAVHDRTRFFDPARLEEIARENTVAGHVARLGLASVEDAATEDARRAVEQGLRIALRVLEVV
ncbi:MAG: metallophosphoesterase family protein [Gemmatimonadota bacterium]